MRKLKDYITSNWETLPKSSFEKEKVVIFEEIQNSNGGWGHHTYKGYGVDKNGDIVVCSSSGCSCSGSCYVSIFNYETDLDPEKIDFNSLEVHFSNY